MPPINITIYPGIHAYHVLSFLGAGFLLGWAIPGAAKRLLDKFYSAIELEVTELLGLTSQCKILGKVDVTVSAGERRLVASMLAVLCSLACLKAGPTIEGLAISWVWVCCSLLSYIDWKSKLLPDTLVLPLLWAGLIYAAVFKPDFLVESVLTAAGNYIVLAAIGRAYTYLRGIDGLGLGDCKLMAALGAWMGWEATYFAIVIGSVGFVAYSIIAGLRGDGRITEERPFGPFLCAGTALSWLLQLRL